MHALIENPDQLARLKNDLSLLNTAADEIIRWVTPVKHFMRTATEDFPLGGKVIKAGDSVLLSYPSGNRDTEAFVDPDKFDIGRSPNKHLSFGFGVHYCVSLRLQFSSMFASKSYLTCTQNELEPTEENLEATVKSEINTPLHRLTPSEVATEIIASAGSHSPEKAQVNLPFFAASIRSALGRGFLFTPSET
jgi:hypothetical protein